MTLTALKKEVLRLPLAQRVRLANAVFESLPPVCGALSFAEREKRAEEALSGSVDMISAEQFDQETEELLNKLTRRRRKSY